MIKKQLLTKVLTLLLLLGSGVGQAWAEDVIVGWRMTGTSAPTTNDAQVGAFIGATNVLACSRWYPDKYWELHTKVKYNEMVPFSYKASDGICLKAGTQFVCLEVKLPNSNTLKQGDVITICGSNQWYVSTDKEGTNKIATISTGTAEGNYNLGSAVLSTDVNSNVIYIARATDSTAGIASFDIKRYDNLTGDVNYKSVFNEANVSSGNIKLDKLKSQEFKFKCHGSLKYNDNYQNYLTWALWVTAEGGSPYILLNTVPQVYLDGSSSPVATTMYKSVNGVISGMTDEDWTTFRNDMRDADVDVKVSFSGTEIFVYALMTANGRTYVYPYHRTLGSEKDAIYINFAVDHSYLTDFEAKTAVSAAAVSYDRQFEGDLTQAEKDECVITMATPEGYPLELNSYVGVGDKVIYSASPSERVISTGYSSTDNPRTVNVSEGEHGAGKNIILPVIKFRGRFAPSLSFTPDPYITYVGATNVGKADIHGVPDDGWDHLVGTSVGDAQIASYNSSTSTWTLGGKAGKVQGKAVLSAYGSYLESTKTYDFIVKPGRRSGSTAKYSIDFSQYLNETEIQAAIGRWNGSSTTQGYFYDTNISNDPNVEVYVKAPAETYNGTQVLHLGNNVGNGWISIQTPSVNASIQTVIIYLKDGNEQKLILNRNDGSGNKNAGTDANGIVTFNANNSRNISISRGDYNNYIECIEIEYKAEAGFSEASATFDLLKLKASASELPKPLGISSAITYETVPTGIAQINSDGSLVFLRDGVTTVKAKYIENEEPKEISYTLTINAEKREWIRSVNGRTETFTIESNEGMLNSNTVVTGNGLTMTYGGANEAAIVTRHADYSSGTGYGVSVISAAQPGHLAPTPDALPASGTYYVFTPSIHGTLVVSGYFAGSHSAVFKKLNEGVLGSEIGRLERDTKKCVSSVFNVEANATYYLYCPLDESGKIDNYFKMNSFSFTPTMALSAKSYLVAEKQKRAASNEAGTGSFYVDLPSVEGAGDYAVDYVIPVGGIVKYEPITTETNGVAAEPEKARNALSALSASIEVVDGVKKLKINSPEGKDGGAIIVNVCVGSSGNQTVLPYVVTVPYIGKHIWNFHNILNKSEHTADSHWYLDWEVKVGGLKEPLAVVHDVVDGDNAAIIDQTNGLYIQTGGVNNMGLAVIGGNEKITGSNDEKNSATLTDVNAVNLVAMKNTTITIPQLKKDWFVKVYLDPHAGGQHGHGAGSEFWVENLCDLYGKRIDPTHTLSTMGVQWETGGSGASKYDLKDSKHPNYNGCVIFRVDGEQPNDIKDVKIKFSNEGWGKVVKIEVTNAYSTELQLAAREKDYYGVDYTANWVHSAVHRVNASGQEVNNGGKGEEMYYNGSPRSYAENAKHLAFKVVEKEGDFNYSTPETPIYAAAHYPGFKTYVTGGTGNYKVRVDAPYPTGTGAGASGFHAIDDVTYILNSQEAWLVVGRLDVQKYPYTWDFESYNMDKGNTIAQLSSTELDKYGAWDATNKSTNHLIDVMASAATSMDDTPFYTINEETGEKNYNYSIKKPLWAQGAQLTYGNTTIPETKGLGISVNHYSYPGLGTNNNVTFDGSKLMITNRHSADTYPYTIKVPDVNSTMWVFVKASEKPLSVDGATEDTQFNLKDNVWCYKANGADVNLNFKSKAWVYKIGVTDQIKEIKYYGWATESRAIAIDHKETDFFSADTKIYKLSDVGGWNGSKYTVSTAQADEITGDVYIPAGTGILMSTATSWTQAQGLITAPNIKVPLFVPAVNIPAVEAANLEGNRLVASTTATQASESISSSKVTDATEYYTLSNYCYKVDKDNGLKSDKIVTAPAFYRYIGSGATMTNKAYIKFTEAAEPSSSKLFSYGVNFDDEDEATAIGGVYAEESIADGADDVYYNVNGQLLNGKPTTRGIYIKNGKKFYVK